MLRHNARAHPQTEAGAVVLLSREEWGKQLRSMCRRDPTAVVADQQPNAWHARCGMTHIGNVQADAPATRGQGVGRIPN